MKKAVTLIVAVLVLVAFTGCATLGPKPLNLTPKQEQRRTIAATAMVSFFLGWAGAYFIGYGAGDEAP